MGCAGFQGPEFVPFRNVKKHISYPLKTLFKGQDRTPDPVIAHRLAAVGYGSACVDLALKKGFLCQPARWPPLGCGDQRAGRRPTHRARRLCAAASAQLGAPREPSRLREWPSHSRSREGPPGRATRKRLPCAPPHMGVRCAGWQGVWGKGGSQSHPGKPQAPSRSPHSRARQQPQTAGRNQVKREASGELRSPHRDDANIHVHEEGRRIGNHFKRSYQA